MARVVEGIALIAGGIALGIFTFGGSVVADAFFTELELASSIAIGIGASLTLGGIASLLQAGPSLGFSVRQSAAPRVCVYGQMRVAGTIIYIGTSNSGQNLNQVIIWASHSCQSVETIYLDGRQVHLSGSVGDGNNYTDPSGNSYSFGPTDVQAVFHTLGSVPGTYFSSFGTEDPTHWNSGMTLDGMTATYLRNGWDVNRFSAAPGVKATIYGRNDIYDPRSATTGYTNNAALVICNFLCDNQWGIGCNYSTEIDETQLIAAANICDEQVDLAAGGTESRYTINGSFDSNSTSGEILDALLQSMEGRISYTGGVWKIYPAAWYGSSLSLDQNSLIDKFQWNPYRKRRDLVNTVRATYISPNYPYAVIGYDQDHKDSSIFSGEWQPTDAPQYAQDGGHGYGTDANYALDGDVFLYATRSYKFTTSCSMAQRLMKIYLLRNRMQGNGSFSFSLAAYQLQAQDVYEFSFPNMFTNQYLEVDSFRLNTKTDPDGKDAPVTFCEITANQTDPSVFDWAPDQEERTPDNSISPTFADPYTVQPPTSVTLTSGSAEATVNQDGIVLPRVLIQWVSPADPFVASGGYIEIQYQIDVLGSPWVGLGQMSPLLNSYFLPGVVSGNYYNVQMRSVRANGAASLWAPAGPILAAATGSLVSYSFGTNAVPNPGFESNVLGNPLGDSWRIGEISSSTLWLVQRQVGGTGIPNSGAANLLIRAQPNIAIANGATEALRVFSVLIPISGGADLYYGGFINWANSIGLNPNLVYLARIGLYFLDNDGSDFVGDFVSEIYVQFDNTPSGTYQKISGTCTSPTNAAFVVFQCSGFIQNMSGSSQSTPNGLSMDLRFDDVFLTQQTGSGLLTGQGSIQPTQALEIPYTVTDDSVHFSWSGQSTLRSDGSTLTIPNGSLNYSGLSASTEYYTYWVADPVTGSLSQTNGSPPGTSPDSLLAAEAGLDGNIMVGTISFTTTASGSGSGTGGGGDICPEAAELVDVGGRGAVPAGDVKAGDFIRGKSFRKNEDVYRRVKQVRRESSLAWRLVQGHRVSPCEPVYVDGKWQPAYRVSSAVDTLVGYKIKISVEADEYDEMNYYLVGEGGELLIHNIRISPC